MTHANRIASLNQQLETLKERYNRSAAILRVRKQRLLNKEAIQERKRETRRLILIGQSVLDSLENNPLLRQWYFTSFPKHIINERERKLFPEIDFSCAPDHESQPPRTSLFMRCHAALLSLTNNILRWRKVSS